MLIVLFVLLLLLLHVPTGVLYISTKQYSLVFVNSKNKDFYNTVSVVISLLAVKIYILFKISYFSFVSTVAQTVPAVADEAAVAPEADPDPGAATATAAPDPALTPDPGRGPRQSLSPGLPGETSPRLLPGRGLAPGPSPAPSPSRGVEPRFPTEVQSHAPGPNPRVGLNHQERTTQSLNSGVDAS